MEADFSILEIAVEIAVEMVSVETICRWFLQKPATETKLSTETIYRSYLQKLSTATIYRKYLQQLSTAIIYRNYL